MVRFTKAQRKQWDEEGYLVVENAYAGADLERLQEAFDRYAEEAKPAWLEEVEAGTLPGAYFDIPKALEKDDAFIDLSDHPGYFGYLVDFLGEDLIFWGPQVRTLPLSPVSYIGWHPDQPHTKSQNVKVQIYVNDVPEDGGAFAFIPGSHKPDAGPYPKVQQLEQMPGHKVFPGKAGTAIMFNTYGFHTSMINRTRVPRKSIILGYGVRRQDAYDPERHTTISDRITTPERRKLFCLL